MSNTGEAVERLLRRHSGKLREAARLVSEAMRLEAQAATESTAATVLPLRSWQRLSAKRCAVWLARYEEVARRRDQVWSPAL